MSQGTSQLNRCPHGCYLPQGESIARDRSGHAYCSGCEAMGGAFVLADGRVHLGGCDGVNCQEYKCSFGRAPIYDHRAYRDANGVDEPLPKYFSTSVRHISSGSPELQAAVIKAGTGHQPAKPFTDKERAECQKPFPRQWRGKAWVAPTFTVIPILDHSQPPARLLTNFCPKYCFTLSNPTRHKEFLGYVVMDGKEAAVNRIFIQTEFRPGLYVPQDHACGERAD